MCDRLEMDLNLLLLKNDLIMLKNGFFFFWRCGFVLIIELGLMEWDAVI